MHDPSTETFEKLIREIESEKRTIVLKKPQLDRLDRQIVDKKKDLERLEVQAVPLRKELEDLIGRMQQNEQAAKRMHRELDKAFKEKKF